MQTGKSSVPCKVSFTTVFSNNGFNFVCDSSLLFSIECLLIFARKFIFSTIHFYKQFFKVSGRENEKNFTDIMRHYRSQPQAASHVYRSVLLKPVAPGDMAAAADKSHAATGAPPTPTRMANTSTVGTDGVERGDLIKFYNTGYLLRINHLRT